MGKIGPIVALHHLDGWRFSGLEGLLANKVGGAMRFPTAQSIQVPSGTQIIFRD